MYWKTINSLLKDTLNILMKSHEFREFRLVGGTALSLQLGHRMSIDIDMFTDAKYGSVNFNEIEDFLEANFEYIDKGFGTLAGIGKSYLVGSSKDSCIKLDVYYTTDAFIEPALKTENVRMATLKEIAAMKIDVIQRTGRKKDFWDIYELLNHYNINDMIAFHKERYKYSHNETLIRDNLINFNSADDDFDPVCLKGNYWEFIKEDLTDIIKNPGLK